MCFSWDVIRDVISVASLEPAGKEVALVSLRLKYYLSVFSEHPMEGPSSQSSGYSQGILGFQAFLDCWRKCFCYVPHSRGKG